jgi:hypothetical protein
VENVPATIRLAVIKINIARIGEFEALVDSGANCSVVRRDVLKGILTPKQNGRQFLVGADKKQVPILGEVPLTIRFKDRVVDLKRVLVLEECVYPVLLGADWLDSSHTLIQSENGQLVVNLRPYIKEESVQRNRGIEQQDRRKTEKDFSIELKMKTEIVKDCSDLNAEVKTISLPEEMSAQIDSYPKLNSSGKDETIFLLHQYVDCVTTSDDPGLTNLAEHRIQTDSQMYSPKGRVSRFAKRTAPVHEFVPNISNGGRKKKEDNRCQALSKKATQSNLYRRKKNAFGLFRFVKHLHLCRRQKETSRRVNVRFTQMRPFYLVADTGWPPKEGDLEEPVG